MKGRLQRLQVARRTVQLLVVGFMILVPAVARYNNYLAARELDRVIERWQGSAAGFLLRLIDGGARGLPGAEVERAGRLRRNRGRVRAYTGQLRGGPWSAEVGPVSATDPLGALESIGASRTLSRVLLLGLLLPLLVTLLFGRVFCAWLCPVGLLLEMTDRLRGVLRFLEIRPRNLHMSRGIKYGLLAVGLVLTLALCRPVLGYIYPPAILNRELHGFVFAIFDRAEIGRFDIRLVGFSWMMTVVLLVALFEILVSRRWWCRYVCPGGALYSLIGWARPVRVRLSAARCTECVRCVVVCPMGLNPMKNRMGLECDNCGACISSCDDEALSIGFVHPLRRARSGVGREIESISLAKEENDHAGVGAAG